jgi:hypothetical protein
MAIQCFPEMLVLRHSMERQLKNAKCAGIRRRRILSLAFWVVLTPSLVGCAGITASNSSPAAATGPHLEVTPSTVSFSAIVGEPDSQTLKISNSGSGSLTVSRVSATGTGLSISGFPGRVVLTAGASTTFNVHLSPAKAGSVNGSISIATSSPMSGTTLPVTGEVSKANLGLTVGPTSVNFGTVSGSKVAIESVVLKNTGNAEVTVSGISVRGAGFSVKGAGVPVKLGSSQSATFDVEFTPTAVGSYNGTLVVASNATDAALSVPLSGKDVSSSAAAPGDGAHWVGLIWSASTSPVSGYNIYRGATHKGPFTRLNGSLVTELTYADSAVTAGDTYFYVTTAVSDSGEESAYSNSAEAVVP